jgi:hypothetical protein
MAMAPRPGSLEWLEQRIAEEQAKQVRRAYHTALTAAAAARERCILRLRDRPHAPALAIRPSYS